MISKKQYVALSNFRSRLAGLQRFSERAARAAGIMPTQYLLLLHIRGFPGRDWASCKAALIGRCAALQLVSKRRSDEDARRVEVHLTSRGRTLLERIAARHRDELKSLRAVFRVTHVS
jgi:hypothetical protein